MDFLKDLNPQTALMVVGLWLFREFLGWARGFAKDLMELRKAPDPVQATFATAECKQVLDVIKEVANHIGELTKLNQEFVYELRGVRDAISRVEQDVEDLKRRDH